MARARFAVGAIIAVVAGFVAWSVSDRGPRPMSNGAGAPEVFTVEPAALARQGLGEGGDDLRSQAPGSARSAPLLPPPRIDPRGADPEASESSPEGETPGREVLVLGSCADVWRQRGDWLVDAVDLSGRAACAERVPVGFGSSFALRVRAGELIQVRFLTAGGTMGASRIVDAGLTASEPDAVGGSGTIDLGHVLLGDMIELAVRVSGPGGAPQTATDLWCHPSSQRGGVRGIRGVGIEAPIFAGSVDGVGERVIQVPEHAFGGHVIALSEAGVAWTALSAACERQVELTLAPWRELEIEVRAGGRPVADAEVRLGGGAVAEALLWIARQARGPAGVAAARTDASGSCALLLPPDVGVDGYVAAAHPDHGSAGCRLWRDAPADAEGRVVLELPVRPLVDPDLRVVCSDRYGAILTEARVRGGGVPWHTDSAGAHLPPARPPIPAPARIEAGCPGFVSEWRQVDARSRGLVELRLERAGPLRVRFVDDAGAPVPGVSATLDVDPRMLLDRRTAVSDATGVALFPVTPADQDRPLRVVPPDPVLSWSRPPQPGSGGAGWTVPAGAEDFVVELERSARSIRALRVLAVDAESGVRHTIERLHLAVSASNTEPPRAPRDLYLGADRALVGAIAEGSYLLLVQTTEGALGATELVIGPDSADEVLCAVARPRTLRGRVVGLPPDTSSTSVLVAARLRGAARLLGAPPDRAIWPTTTQARCRSDGSFLLEGLLPSLYDVELAAPLTSAQAEPVDMLAQDGLEIELRAGGPSGILVTTDQVRESVTLLKLEWRRAEPTDAGGASGHVLTIGLDPLSSEPLYLPASAGRWLLRVECSSEDAEPQLLTEQRLQVGEGSYTRVDLVGP